MRRKPKTADAIVPRGLHAGFPSFAGAFAALTTLLCLAASGVGGRALWTDEILRIQGQRMSIEALLHFEHLRAFCTQTPAAYLLMRPWQKLLGMETGGFVLSAICGGLATWAVLYALFRILGHRPHPLAALLIATNPLLLYYASELAFYSLWTAAAAAVLAVLATRESASSVKAPSAASPRERRATILRAVALATGGAAFVAFHFAGLFVWMGLSAGVLLVAGRAQGWRAALRRVPALAIPALVNLPMYIGASRAPEHIGSKSLQWQQLSTLPAALGTYVAEVGPSLTGGGWLGVAACAFGGWALWRRGGALGRRMLGIALAFAGSVVLFLAYSHLRDYMPHVARYWAYGVAPATFVLGFGVHSLLEPEPASPRRRLSRATGLGVGAALLAANALVAATLVMADGRPHPHKLLQRYLATLPAGRQVVSSNFYENRFLGGYYPIPNGGRMLSPCAWEEGAEARVQGLRAIWALAPEAVAFVPDPERADEFRQAGAPSLEHGFGYEWPRLLRWTLDLGLYPERGFPRAAVPALRHDTRERLAARADADGKALVTPDPGWRVVQFRAPPQGTMRFALLAPQEAGGRATLALYIPPVEAPAGGWQLEAVVAAYGATRLAVEVNGKPLAGASPQLPATRARSVYLPQRQMIEGLPRPEHLLAAGMQFAVELQPATLRIPLGNLASGWSTVTLGARQDVPWLLLSHACAPMP